MPGNRKCATMRVCGVRSGMECGGIYSNRNRYEVFESGVAVLLIPLLASEKTTLRAGCLM